MIALLNERFDDDELFESEDDDDDDDAIAAELTLGAYMSGLINLDNNVGEFDLADNEEEEDDEGVLTNFLPLRD